jgi:hypothetical protein
MWKLVVLLALACRQSVHAQSVLTANPGPANNADTVDSALLFDVEATRSVVITGITTASAALPSASFSVRVYTRDGSAAGGPVGTEPGSSALGWPLRATVTATEGSGEVSLPITLPDLTVTAGHTLGIALQFLDAAARYFGSGTPPIETYGNSALTLRTGDARSSPFSTAGASFSSRAMVGSLRYRLADPELIANPGPINNTGANNSGLFFDLQSATGARINGLETATQAAPGSAFQIEIHTRTGTALGNTATTGPATSPAGWTLRATVDAVQGADAISMPITIPPLTIPAGQTVGVGLMFRGAGPAYFGIGSAPLETYSSPGLVLVTGAALSAPLTTSGNYFVSRAVVGRLFWHPLRDALPLNQGPSDNVDATGLRCSRTASSSTPRHRGRRCAVEP